ncbi:MAG: hypothetical protein ACTHNW_20090 [Mucilaginibacter sp.]
MNKILWYLLALILITGCETPPARKNLESLNVTKPIYDKRASIINLVATPERYDKKVVRVVGFLNLEFEANAIYLNKEDCSLGIDKNAVWIDTNNIDSADYHHCNHQYVILEGTFIMANKGHRDSYSGAITKITRIDLLNKQVRTGFSL